MKRGVLLLNMGGPNNIEEVELFLRNMFADPHILPMAPWLRRLIGKRIVRKRLEEARENYRELGGKSPLTEITWSLAAKVEEQTGLLVRPAMRYVPPFADTALLVGYAGSELSFRRIHDTLSQRESTVISYKVLRPFESPVLYLPPRHRELITDLYAGIGVTLQDIPPSPKSERPVHSQLQESVVTALNIAEIVLECAGSDLPDQLGQLTRRLCIAKLDLLYLFIDLEAPEAPEAVAEAEALGYFFPGIFPRYHHRHSIVLQYLNNIAFDYEAIVTLSPISERLKAYLHDHDPNQIEE